MPSPSDAVPATDHPTTAANRLGLNYRAEAERLGRPIVPIIDAHAHINGARASAIYKDVCDLYGIERVFTQTQMSEAEAVRDVLGDRARFVAIPNYMDRANPRAFREDFLAGLDVWCDEFGARMVKLWNAPRWIDLCDEYLTKNGHDVSDMLELDSPWRVKIAERATELGMMMMTHVADPDTWFATKYADAKRYKTKREHYEPLERMIERFPVPWLAAHCAGWPEDLVFLTDLLERHDNLIIDTSATKWMVRELSRHPSDELIAFLQRFEGRVLFGSDIVTSDAHLAVSGGDDKGFGVDLADSDEAAFDLYASRYWALRTMYETDYDGESNIADPDLMMVDPEQYDAMSAPRLVGHSLPASMLKTFYRGATEATLERWYRDGTMG